MMQRLACLCVCISAFVVAFPTRADTAPPADAGVVVDAVAAPAVAAVPAMPVAPVAPLAPAEIVDVVARDVVAPLRFIRGEGQATARARAAAASRALVAALDQPPTEPAASMSVVDDAVVVRVGVSVVATFTAADVQAEGGTDLSTWAAAHGPALAAFVDEQRQRDAIRHGVTQLTLSVTIALLAVLLLQAQRRVFAAWQASLEQRTSTTNVLGVPFVSIDTSRALLGGGLHILRALSVGGIVFAALVTIGGQFARTRPWVDALVDGVFDPVVRGANAALRGVPGALLAVVVGIVALAVVRFVRLFLDGVAAGRVRSSLLQPHQAPVASVVVPGVVLAVAGLLVVAAFFLRFGTSVEQLVLVAATAVALGAVPFFANAIAGLAVQWRQPFAIGDHVRVGSAHGEVVRIRLNDVLLVPEEGGTITVPMLTLLLRPVQRMPSEPRAHIDTVVARSKGSDAVLQALQLLVAMLDERGTVDVRAATATTLSVRLIAGRGDGAEQRLWRALLRACDAGEVRLAERGDRGHSSDSGPVPRAEDRS
jgi:small-conductance mechanosensitive channel